MVVSVDGSNEAQWAGLWEALGLELWGDDASLADHFLEERGKIYYHNEFIYCADGVPVGLLSLGLRHDYVEGTKSSPVAYLEGIYVAPSHRGRGITRELVGFAKKWAKEKGCVELASDCELGNDASEAFHKAVGFKEANRIICFTMDI